MANGFLCPVCMGYLQVANYLVVAARNKSGDKGLIFLNPEIGNYTKTTHPKFILKQGEAYSIHCPICHAILNKEENSNLVKMHLLGEKGEEMDVFFSGIVGEECTYVIKDKMFEARGHDQAKYEKYFDIPEQYKKYL